MAKRKTYDWEAIEREYRTGQLSNREISRQYDVPESSLRSRAKARKWAKDLSSQVKQKVKENLLRSVLRSDCATDEEIIEVAARRGADIIDLHRDHISKSRESVSLLLDQLVEAATKRVEIEGENEEETKGDSNLQRRNLMFKAVALPAHSSVAVHLTSALKNLINLERQAYNLGDDDEPKENALSEILTDLDIGGLPANE